MQRLMLLRVLTRAACSPPAVKPSTPARHTAPKMDNTALAVLGASVVGLHCAGICGTSVKPSFLSTASVTVKNTMELKKALASKTNLILLDASGTFTNVAVKVTAPCTILSQGGQARLHGTGSKDVFTVDCDAGNPVIIKNIAIRDGGIFISRASVVIEECSLLSAPNDAIVANAGSSVEIYATSIAKADCNGVSVLDGSQLVLTGGAIEDCGENGVAAMGQKADPQTHVEVVGATIQRNGSRGVWADEGAVIQVDKCTVRDNAKQNFRATSSPKGGAPASAITGVPKELVL